MLKTYSAFFNLLHSIADILVIAGCWVLVYFLRFKSGLFETTLGVPEFRDHLLLLLPIVCISYLGCLWAGLYKSKRVQHFLMHFTDFSKVILLISLLIVAFFYYAKSEVYSRKLLVLFIVMLFFGLSLSHLFVISVLKQFRKRGYNIRYYIIIGAGEKGKQLLRDIQNTGWLGLKCLFFVDNDPDYIGTEQLGIPVYGPVDKLSELISGKSIEEIYLALGGNQAQRVYPILESLQCTGITIRIIPDWGNLMSISQPVVVPIGSQLLFSAADSPLSGYKILLKHAFDFCMALFLLILFLIPMTVIAVLIKLTSKGPVFYKQTRMGMDSKSFEIIKFRTMKCDAEKDSGPQWSTQDDDRRTAIGKWLRTTSLDEIPQVINVLKGQMSMVGPRPERPHFVKQFSDEYKKYMLRHKVKAGITGWAQINGYRGDTSLRKRLVYDLYYVRNWSFTFDLWILLQTPWHVIKGENAH
jgi:exopolysaccharide biosynthesis polyprenyl glycosylphosphotransferase